MQGVRKVPMQEFKLRKKALIKEHYAKKAIPSCHPIKEKQKAPGATEMGFQYMAKALPASAVQFERGFSEEALNALYEASAGYRNNLTGQLGEYIASRCIMQAGETPRNLHWHMTSTAWEYYMEKGKMAPRHFQDLVRHELVMKYGSNEDVLEYVVSISMPPVVPR